jgi:hypothetical protein
VRVRLTARACALGMLLAPVLLAGCASTSSSRSAPEDRRTDEFSFALLNAEEMPVGWHTAVAPDDGGEPTLTCSEPEPPVSRSTYSEADFTKGEDEFLVEQVRIYASPSEAMDAFERNRRYLTSCTSGTSDGNEFTITGVPLPDRGDESAAVQLTGDLGDGLFVMQYCFVVQDRALVVLQHGRAGVVSTELSAELAQRAIVKATGGEPVGTGPAI